MEIEGEDVTIRYSSNPNSYIAKITGSSEKYGYEREFIKPYDTQRSSTGKTGFNTYDLIDFEEDEIYEIKEGKHPVYYKFVNSEFVELDKKDVKRMFK